MSKKESLITCDRVYYQLKWHENADQKKAHLKFLNFGQLKTIPYHNWIPIDKGGEVPWHRVYEITYAGKVLWNRENREYYPEILNEQNNFSNIDILKYNDKKWSVYQDSYTNYLPDKIKIITFNCLIDLYDKHITNSVPRLPVILEYIQKYNADIICLQEITIKMKKAIMDNQFIKDNYYVTSNEPKIFGQMMLSKIKPISQNMITFDGNHMKKYLLMTFKNKYDEVIEIYNIHLTSNQQINSDKKRDGQIDQLFGELQEDKVIIVGDLNNDDKAEYSNFLDTWDILKNEDGFTFDYIENKLTSKLTKSFIRTRIDKVLFRNLKPISINLGFNKPINNIWPSDHFGLVSEFSSIEDYNEENISKTNDFIVKSGTILCLILEPIYWTFINSFRNRFDDGYNKYPPHVTLFQNFVSVNDWPLIKSKILNLKLEDVRILFNKVEIFDLTKKFAVVLTSDEFYKINSLRKDIENIINIRVDSRPHITLGIFDSDKKANTIKSQIENDLPQIEVSISNLTFMERRGDQYQVYDHIGLNKKYNVFDLVIGLAKNICNNLKYDIIGSRAYGITDSDYDIVLYGDEVLNIFCEKYVSMCKMCSYFKYCKFVESKIPTINLLTIDNDEVNIIYQNNKNINKSVLNSIDSVKEVKRMVGDKLEIFSKCYYLVRIWAKNRNIYGSKYGYFNGVTWLILTLNIFIKIEVKNERMFIRNFFKYYNSYDWSIPINIKNLPVKIETKSDKLVYICNIIDNEKLVRTLSPTTWNIILDEFRRTENEKDLNYIFKSKKLPQSYVKITITDVFLFNRLEKKNQLSSEIWKLCIKTNSITPFINWIEKDQTLIYYFGITGSSDFEVICSYFRKYLCSIEFL